MNFKRDKWLQMTYEELLYRTLPLKDFQRCNVLTLLTKVDTPDFDYHTYVCLFRNRIKYNLYI